MRRVGSRELKNRLGMYLALVKQGHSLLITERGRPVATLTQPADSNLQSRTVEQVLGELETRGTLQRSRRPIRPFSPTKTRGKPASQIIIEDRR
jgi:prevent-host-death family protein